MPILPGIMPILNLAAIRRQGELIGTDVPDDIVARISSKDGDPVAMRAEGIAIAGELCEELLDGGAPGLHFYTLNRSKATREIFEHLKITV
jgi:methylenetetrahydrofolate reductase (NADPH)